MTWNLEPQNNGQQLLICEWREANGPPVPPLQRRGYGTELINSTAKHLGGEAELTFDAGGLTAIIKLQM